MACFSTGFSLKIASNRLFFDVLDAETSVESSQERVKSHARFSVAPPTGRLQGEPFIHLARADDARAREPTVMPAMPPRPHCARLWPSRPPPAYDPPAQPRLA